MKNTKKSLLLSFVSLLLCFSMLLGTTFAWFTDSVSSGSNVITSGNLDIEVQYTLDGETWNDLDGAEDLFSIGLWEPGHTEVVALKITNKGSLALKYSANMNIINETVGKNKDGGDIVLSDILTVSTLVQQANDIGDIAMMLAFSGENGIAYESTTSFKNVNVFRNSQDLFPGDSHYAFIKVDMPETVGNEANHDGKNPPSIEFGINVIATQTSSESDSFGNDYDNGLAFDDFADTNVLASSTKTLSEGADSIDFALYSKGIRIAKLTVPASAIADTFKPVKVIIDGIDPSEEAMVDESTQAYAYDIKVTNLKSGLTGDQLVTVVVAAPNALAAMKAYHNGELIEDAVYDEVAGTITFKTASFSPFDFASNVENVETLDELRAALQKDGTTAKLINNIIVDLTKGSGAARVDAHAYVGTNNTYYNGVMINGKNVGLDLNGHNITAFCGDQYNSNSDVGALFFVGKEGSLNITNTGAVETGFIKMASSIYAVWAPFADPSYVDIYGGAFIGDSYAGDPIGTSTAPDSFDGTMQNENSNRALIYAGFGGNINVYGGYFLYNNTPNDLKNRNNGAFNAKDFYSEEEANEKGPLITIHDGVMLINKEYRQNPQYTSQPNGDYDNFSVVLAEDHVINEVNLDSPVVIDVEKYSTWYEVTRQYKYKVIFKNAVGDELDTQYIKEDGEVTVDDIDDTAYGKLPEEYKNDFGGWTNAASDPIGTIEAGNTKDIVLYPVHSKKYTVTWLDEDGNVLNAVTTSGNTPNYSSVKASAPPNPPSRYTDLVFSHWEVRTVVNGAATSVEITDSYQIKSNISLYPVYEYNGSLDLIAVDTDGDGVANYYAVSGSDLTNSPDFIIPADVNGTPVQEIRTGAFADGDLRDVVIPNSVNYIGKNAFCADGREFPQIQIIFEGTKEEWNALPKETGWDDNIGHDSVIICTEEDPIGYFNQAGSNGFLGFGAKIDWQWVSGKPDWYPRNYD